jgi:hypothetical protein
LLPYRATSSLPPLPVYHLFSGTRAGEMLGIDALMANGVRGCSCPLPACPTFSMVLLPPMCPPLFGHIST